jgi:hypothetical protein
MQRIAASLALAFSTAVFGQVATPELNKVLSAAAQQLAGMTFDSNASVTIRGRISTLVWPERSSGMIVVEASDGGKYAFSTAGVPAMAKQGFTRLAVHPGEEVIVTGVLAASNAKIGPGLTAARSDLITKSDGSRVFDRSRLPQ